MREWIGGYGEGSTGRHILGNVWKLEIKLSSCREQVMNISGVRNKEWILAGNVCIFASSFDRFDVWRCDDDDNETNHEDNVQWNKIPWKWKVIARTITNRYCQL